MFDTIDSNQLPTDGYDEIWKAFFSIVEYIKDKNWDVRGAAIERICGLAVHGTDDCLSLVNVLNCNSFDHRRSEEQG